MRRTINISMPEQMQAYLREECGDLSVSEYIRLLIRRDQQRSKDVAARAAAMPLRVNDCIVIAHALEQLEKLRAILLRRYNEDD